MKRLDRYIVRQVAVPSLLALAVLSFLAVTNEIRERLADFAMFVTPGDLIKLTILFLPVLFSLIIPMTFLMGLLLTFGRLAQQQEIVAMQASGLSLKRVAAPIIVCGVLLSGLCFFVQDRVQPWAVKRAFQLIYTELPERATMDRLPTGVPHEYEGWRVYIADRDEETRTLLGLDLVRPADETTGEAFFYADSARFARKEGDYELVLMNGHVITEDNVMVRFDEQRLSVPGPSELLPRNARKMLTLRQLFQSETDLQALYTEVGGSYGDLLHKERREIAERLSLPFAALACTLAAAPLGVRARHRGRSFAFAAGAVVAIAYGLLYILSEPTGLRSLEVVIARAWLPNIVLIIAGMGLLWRLDRIG